MAVGLWLWVSIKKGLGISMYSSGRIWSDHAYFFSQVSAHFNETGTVDLYTEVFQLTVSRLSPVFSCVACVSN